MAAKETNKGLATGALVGILAGFVAGLLTAPKSGKETRKTIKKTAKKLGGETEKKLKILYTELSEKSSKLKAEIKTSAGSKKNDLQLIHGKIEVQMQRLKELLSTVRDGQVTDDEVKEAIQSVKELKADLEKKPKSNPKEKSAK